MSPTLTLGYGLSLEGWTIAQQISGSETISLASSVSIQDRKLLPGFSGGKRSLKQNVLE